MAIYLITAHKKGISSLQLSRDIDVTQKTAWFVLHRVREIFQPNGRKLSGYVEADETFIGGKEQNKHFDKRGLKKKTAVLGMVQRNGQIDSMPVKDTSKATLQTIINMRVRKGSRVITDDYVSYDGLNKKYKHRKVFHNLGEHAVGIFHTNTIEGFWSLLKRGLIGIYHNVSPKHLERYCNEFDYRYNTKKQKDSFRFAKTLENCKGKLMYATLIK